MKPTMVFAIILLTVIVMIASFDLQFAPTTPVVIPPNMSGEVLYVCPTASSAWDSFATSIKPFSHYLVIGFFFATMVLMFHWGWAMYQNLLKDKFDRNSFTNSWKFTKFLFWIGVIIYLGVATPNHFRRVHISGAPGDYILCENDTPGARAVRASAVTRLSGKNYKNLHF
jgi:hypothetical protein